MQIRAINKAEKQLVDEVVSIHIATFQGFFLTFMGRGFLKQMYQSYCDCPDTGLLVAFDDSTPIGFLAYSGDMSRLYKYMIKSRLIPFAWYSLGAVVLKPKAFMKLIGAFLKPRESERTEAYVRLASIGVKPDIKTKGTGTQLLDKLKEITDFRKYAYIMLETDADGNNGVNHFYQKNGFVLEKTYTAEEGRKMNEYRFKP